MKFQVVAAAPIMRNEFLHSKQRTKYAAVRDDKGRNLCSLYEQNGSCETETCRALVAVVDAMPAREYGDTFSSLVAGLCDPSGERNCRSSSCMRFPADLFV